MLKKYFVDSLKKLVGNEKKIAISLSSGIDSHCVLFGCLELEVDIQLYNFNVQDVKSQDYIYSIQTAKIFNLPIINCSIPNKVNIDNVLKIINKYNKKKKVDVECIYPFLYLLPFVKEKVLLTGSASDGHFGISKKAMIHYKNDVEKLMKYRKSLFDNPDYAQRYTLNKIAETEYGIKVKTPFGDSKIVEYFYYKKWDDINRPKQKQSLLDMFPNQFKKIKIFNHTNLQCGDSMIREIFEPLLDNKKINIKNRIRVMDLYRDLYNENNNKQMRLLND